MSAWEQTLQGHAHSTRERVLSALAEMCARDGLHTVTMSALAQEAGIGRASLYKHFADLDAVVSAWQEQMIHQHVAAVLEAAGGGGGPVARLKAVLTALVRGRALHEPPRLAGPHGAAPGHTGSSATTLHRHAPSAAEPIAKALRPLLREAIEAGEVRDDVPVVELVAFCLRATDGVSDGGAAAERRAVTLVLAALAPPATNA